MKISRNGLRGRCPIGNGVEIVCSLPSGVPKKADCVPGKAFKTDTFTYTFSRFARCKLFVNKNIIEYLGDLKGIRALS